MGSNFYPTQLRSFVNKLHGFSQTTVKLTPLSGTLSAGPRQTITVSLPPNSLILPENFTMWGSCDHIRESAKPGSQPAWYNPGGCNCGHHTHGSAS